VQFLINQGADVNLQDKNGWTALLWATLNGREAVIQILLKAGANTKLVTNVGTSIQNMLERAHIQHAEKLSTLFYLDSPNSETQSLGAMTTATSMTSDSQSFSTYQVDFKEMCDIIGSTVPSHLAQLVKDSKSRGKSSKVSDNESTALSFNLDLNFEKEEYIPEAFDWDSCPVDQMLVFTPDSMDQLLCAVFDRLGNPDLIRLDNSNPKGLTRKHMSANVMFLASRYACHYSGPDILQTLFLKFFSRLEGVIQTSANDMMVLGYWLSNTCRLRYFLKRDSNLVALTLREQVRLNEMIQEIFYTLIQGAQNRIFAVIEDGLLNHSTIPGLNTMKFRGPQGTFVEWEAIAKSKKLDASKLVSRFSSYFSYGSDTSDRNRRTHGRATPKTISTILSSILFVFQTFQIHYSLLYQSVEQLYYFIGASTFNLILEKPGMCCRWKALQVRMNITQLEEWAQSNTIPVPSKDSFTKHFKPLVSLLQLLQIVSHVGSIEELTTILGDSSVLSWSQVYRVLDLYVYEEKEAEILPAIVAQVQTLSKDDQVAIDEQVYPTPFSSPQVDLKGHSPRTEDPNVESFDGPVKAAISDLEYQTKPTTETAPISPDNEMDPIPLDNFQDDTDFQTAETRFRAPTVSISVSETPHKKYMYSIFDRNHFLPFAIPTNAGERYILLQQDGVEISVEEVPTLSDEVTTILDECLL
jgi:hypothetical protein